MAKPVTRTTSLSSAGASDSVRYPWAIGPPKGPLFARSTSTWIHWWSPVASANRLTASWVTSNQSLLPSSWPVRPDSSPMVVVVVMRSPPRVGQDVVPPILHRTGLTGWVHPSTDGWTTCALGHRHWGRAGAAGLLLHRSGPHGEEVLLQHRAVWSHHGGTWGTPGGALHTGEPAHVGALREVREELGLL